jgi:Xaa-Pro aminopeptidase
MTKLRLERLREQLSQKHLSAIIIPTSDPHKSEYIPTYWKSIEWITGFSGSAGNAIVTKKHAGLWTDSRYFVQAEKQLQAPFELHKLKTRQPEYIDWIVENLNLWDTVGLDAQLFSAAEIAQFKTKLDAKHIKITDVGDVFEEIWLDRPSLPISPLVLHDDFYTGQSRIQKIEKIRNHLINKHSEQILISALDDIAWLLNIRGNDIKFNPVFRAYVLINRTEVYLFVDTIKLSPEVKLSLVNDTIILLPYNEITPFLTNTKLSTIELDKNTINYALTNCIPSSCEIQLKNSIAAKLKAIKSSIEIEHYKNAQLNDGLAMCNFLNWLEHSIKTESISEIQAAEKATSFRGAQENYRGLSFAVISAYEANAALPHYSPDPDNSVLLKPKGLYLIDSGAQYLNGTTDITRTVALGEVSSEQITNYTLVLKGHIRLSNAKFPHGTKGFHLDTLARLDLWQHGKDYGHGTGHGIGYFLNVHEGPQGFSQSELGPGNTVIEPGMLITNEPGIYFEGKYGIRIENVMVCVHDNTIESGTFLKFETLTYCPYDMNLIDVTLLNETEIRWINNYHQRVYELLSPKASDEVLQWLKMKTLPIE